MNTIVKDALFGIVGGIAGTAIIGQVMPLIAKLDTEANRNRENELVPEPPTEKLASTASRRVFGTELSGRSKASLGEAVRWGYGLFWGGAYGILRRRVPAIRFAGGLPFGAAMGIIGPAILLPAANLTPGPAEFPVTAHLRGFASHYAYAATVEGVCRLAEKIEEAAGPELRTKPELRRVS